MQSILVIVLFISRNGNRRDLHSFPTRRSSDLVASKAELRQQLAEHGGLLTSRLGQRLCPGLPAVAAQDLDRKSTRLNSSHMSISYAVFCLKKKRGGAPVARRGMATLVVDTAET